MDLIGFDLHAAAAAIALLASPQLAVYEFKIDWNARRQSRDQRDQSLAVRLPGRGKTDHIFLIVMEQ
jgi:hypothetical protein